MGVMNVERGTPSFDDLVAACRAFVEFHAAFAACDKETRNDVEALMALARSDELDEFERDSILATIAQTLFPKFRSTSDENEDLCEVATSEAVAANQSLDQEEETFAQHLSTALATRNMTQSDLASAIGVGQPAVSMMLSRTCRPQRRTVEKIARALGMSVGELWPAYGETLPQAEPYCPVVSSASRLIENVRYVSAKRKANPFAYPEWLPGFSIELNGSGLFERTSMNEAA